VKYCCLFEFVSILGNKFHQDWDKSFNKLNNVHISVFCSDDAWKILWASWVQQLRVMTGIFCGIVSCHHSFKDVTNSI